MDFQTRNSFGLKRGRGTATRKSTSITEINTKKPGVSARESHPQQRTCNSNSGAASSSRSRKFGFGFKRIQGLSADNMNPTSVVNILCENHQDFSKILKSKPDKQFLLLILKLISKISQCQFSNFKIRILSLYTDAEFLDFLLLFVIKDLKSCGDDYIYVFLNEVAVLFETCIELMPQSSVSLIPLIEQSLEVVKRLPYLERYEDISKRIIRQKDHLDSIEKQRFGVGSVNNRDIDNGRSYVAPPNDYRSLSIYPIPEDLERLNFVRPNIAVGHFMDGYHYFDIQFRLLREDFLDPLRAGIRLYKEYLESKDQTKKRNPHLRIYNNVRFSKLIINTQRPEELNYAVQLDKQFVKHIRWESSKRLLYGSLVLFSVDNFNTFFLGTVHDRNIKDLEKGLFSVCLIKGFEKFDFKAANFTMAESTAFFESYFHVLTALQNLSCDQIPMEKYLLVRDIVPRSPPYLNNGVNRKYASTSFNASQYEAYEASLSNEFVVIQGPPGTGKTYLGLKIVKTLLKNYELHNSPIIIVCYTNHALDQFVEGLISTTTEIIRIGGQCKNDNIKQFNLSNIRREHSSTTNEIIRDLKYIQDSIMKYEKAMSIICERSGIIMLPALKDFHCLDSECNVVSLSYEQFIHWILCTDGDNSAVLDVPTLINCSKGTSSFKDNVKLSDLSNIVEVDTVNADSEDSDDENYLRRNQAVVGHFEEFLNKDSSFYDIDLVLPLEAFVKYSDGIEEVINKVHSDQSMASNEKKKVLNLLLFQLRFINDLQANIGEHLKTDFGLNNKKVEKLLTLNPWKLDEIQRWAVYFYLCSLAFQNLKGRFNEIKKNHSVLMKRLKEARDMEIFKTILRRRPQIVALTTTGAARCHDILEALQSRIVVIEEAAEVLEAHVITSLTKSVEHVILIGDHMQLRPNPSTMFLARKYKLDVSLFERMLNNGMNCYSLKVQHRMRPEIAALVSPSIYPYLQNHSSVLNFDDVKGVKRNLFFLTHNVYEDKTDEFSHSNCYEGDFVIALCKYLLLQGYSDNEITILTVYSGQQFYLRSLKKKLPLLKNVRITVVDNYQGEENKIILLSLVRSNEKGEIGFLGTKNRLCVALSRAKEGLYVIGNMDNLTEKSDLWKTVLETFQQFDAFGAALPLVCQIHETETLVSSAADFVNVQEGGCNRICERMKPCGHYCKSLCHPTDLDHTLKQCHEPCIRNTCEFKEHRCPKLCYQECGPCEVLMSKELPCHHVGYMCCFEDPKEFKCQIEVEDVKPNCNHPIKKPCWQPVHMAVCPKPCIDRLDCGHACSRTCHVDDDPEHLNFKCLKDCSRLNLNCKKNHLCKKRCHENCGKCLERIRVKMDCDHTNELLCSDDIDAFVCMKKCAVILPCKHNCKKKCFEDCGDCPVKVVKTITECGHKIKVNCSQTPNRTMCNKKCTSILLCGHPCKRQCNRDCLSVDCTEIVDSNGVLACGHQAKVPCYISQSNFDRASDHFLKFCQKPCGTILPCEHLCKGTCGECFQGRLHQPCAEACNNTLVCGHSCNVPCRDECPPCKKSCLYFCEHSKCTKKCGDPCISCKEKCTYSCRHKQCRKLCGQICDRAPCYEPCPERLPCGHECVGFCGEPCPPLCGECPETRDILQEIFFGTENDEDARFVLLNDCRHVLESTGLDNWFLADTNDNDKRQINMKRCPKCNTPIVTTKRFMNYVKEVLKDISIVRNRIFGDIRDNTTRKKTLLLKSGSISELLERTPAFVSTNRDLMTTISYVSKILTFKKRYVPALSELKLAEFLIHFIIDCLKNISMLHGEPSSILFEDSFKYKKHVDKLENRVGIIFSHLSLMTSKISNQEVNQFLKEKMRIDRMTDFCLILTKRCYETDTVIDCISQLSNLLYSVKMFNDGDDLTCIDLLKKLNDSFKNTFWQSVTQDERRLIHMAMTSSFHGSKQGHWFKCRNGHIYVITECGGAMQTSRCPECKETIGGSSHRLVSSSQLASEMDGARHPAWPEGNNFANYDM